VNDRDGKKSSAHAGADVDFSGGQQRSAIEARAAEAARKLVVEVLSRQRIDSSAAALSDLGENAVKSADLQRS